MGAPAISTSDLELDPELEVWTRKPHVPLGKLLLLYADSFRALGLRDPCSQLLGIGSFGAAYQIRTRGIDSVLKLTRDPYEVMTCSALRGKHLKHVVTIYEVWSLSDTLVYQHWAPWYAVHRALLHPLSGVDVELTEFLFDLFFSPLVDVWLPKAGPRGRGDRDRWRTYIQEGYDSEDEEGRPIFIEGYSGQRAQRAMMLLDGIGQAVREMDSVGIEWSDFHSDNMMRDRAGNLRVADVGCGQVRRNLHFEPEPLSPNLAGRHAKSWAP